MPIKSVFALELTSKKRQTKIIATVGPKSRSEDKIRALIEAGVNVFRLNFSHGTHKEHSETFEIIRRIAKELESPVAILQDLCGPKIRITNIEGDFATIPPNTSIELRHATGNTQSTSEVIYVETTDPTKILTKGDRVFLADGMVELTCLEVTREYVKCVSVKGGRIRSKVGIAFPDSEVELPATTKKDFLDLEWGISHAVDFVAVSFVSNKADIEKVRKQINSANSNVQVIAKIERRTALENIQEIIEASDGIMVARGDLGIDLPLEKIPLIQKKLIEIGVSHNVPVIVATQMLHSMVNSIIPTRAEVSDITAAVLSGTDALMLSEETAIGDNPIECVEYLGKIALEAERSFKSEEHRAYLSGAAGSSIADAVALASCAASEKLSTSALIATSLSGKTAKLIAKYRPQVPLFGVSPDQATKRRMSLYWGVTPLSPIYKEENEDETVASLRAVQNIGGFKNDELAVITSGLKSSNDSSTCVMKIVSFSKCNSG